MALFDRNKNDSKDEVRVSVPEGQKGRHSNSSNSKLRSEVESKVGSSGSGETRIDPNSSSGTRNSSVDLEDIHRQNEKIISLLEQISGEENQKDHGSSSRVTERKDKSEKDNDIGGGMNELL